MNNTMLFFCFISLYFIWSSLFSFIRFEVVGLVESLNFQFLNCSAYYIIYEKGLYVVVIAFFFYFCFTVADNDLCLFTLRYFWKRKDHNKLVKNIVV